MTDPTGDPGPSRIVLDARALRALSHPLRVRVLGLLRRNGPSTATRLAGQLDLNSGATSYHLRQLAAAGLVEEDTERGNARDRWWRAVHRSSSLDDNELADSDAGQAYLQSVLASQALLAQRTVNNLPALRGPWREAFDLSNWGLRLTPEEAVRLNEELAAVVGRYRSDVPELRSQAPAGAERVTLILHQLPEPEPEPEAEEE
ncbi:helix-turn-helix domain-containing protein [Kitasatospora sp. NPDC006697]|uniref:helix-turn-helix domain-containing protein n=1 Tax=Kitasatospora sp. NPDC006697 TaxID=3364020 RepID=UPI0036D1EBB7